MSLNPGADSKSLYDVLEGSVSSYFQRLPGVLQRNESVNGQYQTVVSSCYGGNTPVKIPGFTRVCISTNGTTIVDMSNSFITMELKYKLRLNGSLGAGSETVSGHRTIFVGFKNSLEALSRYDIYVNANKIYSQAWVGPESYVYNLGTGQVLRERNPYVYTCSKNVQKMSNDVCGVYFTLSDGVLENGQEFDVTIPVKINLHQILMFSSIQYLPSFTGRWEIELYPNWNNLVVLPVEMRGAVSRDKWHLLANAPEVDLQQQDFVQIGKPFKFVEKAHLTKLADSTIAKLEFANQTMTGGCPKNYIALSPVDGTLTQCLVHITTFQLRYEVFEGLRQMYSEQPLIIPVNILTYSRFSGQPGRNEKGEPYHATLSQSLENCDSLFVLIPSDSDQTTCFYQPYLREVRMSLGEFGIHPARTVCTWDDPAFVHMCLDALNLESAEITGLNEDVLRSLNGDRSHWMLAPGTGGLLQTAAKTNVLLGDKSNFFIGISLSQVGFQSGTVSSPNTNIPFIFDASLDRELPNPISTSIICMFLFDCALMIQVVPGSDIPVVKLTNKSIV
jgi:hypothetical protein